MSGDSPAAYRRTRRPAARVVLAGVAALVLVGCMHRASTGGAASSGATGATVSPDPLSSVPAEERVTMYQDSLTVAPNNAALHFKLGNAYYDLHQLSRAVEEYQASVRLDSTYANAWGNLGTALEEQDDLDGALKAYQKGVELAPKDAAAWSNLGSVHYAKGTPDKAMDAYRHALTLDPKNVQALYNIDVGFADARIYKEAIRYWQQVLEIAPKSEAGKNAQTNISLLQSLRQAEENKKAAAERASQKPGGESSEGTSGPSSGAAPAGAPPAGSTPATGGTPAEQAHDHPH